MLCSFAILAYGHSLHARLKFTLICRSRLVLCVQADIEQQAFPPPPCEPTKSFALGTRDYVGMSQHVGALFRFAIQVNGHSLHARIKLTITGKNRLIFGFQADLKQSMLFSRNEHTAVFTLKTTDYVGVSRFYGDVFWFCDCR